MTTESEPSLEAAPAAEPTPAPPPPVVPRITPAPISGERLPQMIERTRRRGRRRRAPTFTPQEVQTIDYKDVDQLKKLISDRGRIEPRRKTGLTAKDQRKLAREIKRAREMALLPYTAEHMRQTSRFRMVARAAQRAMRAELDDAPAGDPAEGGAAQVEGGAAQAEGGAAQVEAGAAQTDGAPAPAEAAQETAPAPQVEAVAETAAADAPTAVADPPATTEPDAPASAEASDSAEADD